MLPGVILQLKLMDNRKHTLLIYKKLSGQINEKESQQLDSWLKVDPANMEHFTELKSIWEASENYPSIELPDLESEKQSFLIQKELLAASRSSKRRRVFLPLGVAAVLLLVLAAIYFLRPTLNNPEQNFFGADKTLVLNSPEADLNKTLEDGSQVWLKKGGELLIGQAFGEDKRKVFLTGEAFFNVSENVSHPFIVGTDVAEIMVVGTAFYVRSDESQLLQVAVEEGIVELSIEGKEATKIDAGYRVNYQKDSKEIEIYTDQNPVQTEWKKNYLVFKDLPLETVFEKLSLYFGVTFDIRCENIHQMKGFTSLIQSENEPKLEGFIISIEKLYGLSIEQKGVNNYLVNGEACN